MPMHSQNDPDHLDLAADTIADGGVVGFFFNGAYALLGDADQSGAADTIFELKRRPPERTLSLVTDPRCWAEFVDLDAASTKRFPFDQVCSLHDDLHALGVILPASAGAAPPHLVQDGTILNVWSRYEPLISLQARCRKRGRRALLGASANLSGEPTYTTAADMVRVFGSRLGALFAPDPAVAPERRNSVSLVDLTGVDPVLRREGNTTEAEVRAALASRGLGDLVVPPSVVRL